MYSMFYTNYTISTVYFFKNKQEYFQFITDM